MIWLMIPKDRIVDRHRAVTAFTFSLLIMEVLVNSFRQLLANSFDLGQCFNAGTFDFTNTTELSQKLLPAFGAKPWNAIKRGLRPSLRSPLPVPRNCESVRLITDLLDQQQGRGVRG